MNREIKFRIWDTAEKKFLSLKDYQALGGIEVETDGTLTLSPRFRFLSSMMIMPERFIPCEYTGLKDKNSVEIYEGDILKVYFDVSKIDDYIFLSLSEEEKEKGYFLKKVEIPEFYRELLSDNFEVIGNIYENEVTNANTTN